jgi:putative lipoic acid-binding regulatory protein
MTKKSKPSNGSGNGQEKETLLEFPCRFPIKAMGRAGGGFEAIVTHIVRSHAELWPGESVTANPSRNGNYVAVTLVIEATSQMQLDAIYMDLTESPEVLMAL